MSFVAQIITAAQIMQDALGLRVLASVVIDASTTAPQLILGPLTQETYITQVQVVRVDGAALTLATLNLGYNATAYNDVVNTQGLISLASIGLALPLTLNSGMAVGQTGQSLYAKMGVTVGSGHLRVTVIGEGG